MVRRPPDEAVSSPAAFRMKKLRFLKVPDGTKVAFQGEPGAFSQAAAHRIFRHRIDAVPCPHFEAVFESVAKKKSRYAVIPIENSLAGSIHQNFDLLTRYSLEAIGETFLRIEHHLIAGRNTRLSQIKSIYSHPVALAQCQGLLKKLKRVEKISFYDTAGSVKYIRDNQLENAAAIASAGAARMYRMKIMKSGIEDNPENFTRFLALARRRDSPRGGPKTSIVFGVRNEPAALFKVLSVFALRNIDLTKIESRPIPGRPWQYLFYVDLQSDVRSQTCSNALRHLREMTLYFQMLGSYPTIS